jgi:hypothetical protein
MKTIASNAGVEGAVIVGKVNAFLTYRDICLLTVRDGHNSPVLSVLAHTTVCTNLHGA